VAKTAFHYGRFLLATDEPAGTELQLRVVVSQRLDHRLHDLRSGYDPVHHPDDDEPAPALAGPLPWIHLGVDDDWREGVRTSYPTRSPPILATMSAAEEPRPEIPGYALLDPLGSGGMGVVYAARRVGDPHLSAVKVLRGSLMSHRTVVRRFRKEVDVLMLQRHPGIVRLIDAGYAADGRMYLSTEYIAGQDLFHVIQRCGAMPPKVWLDLADQFLSAIAAAHELTDEDGLPVRLVHRDIKPENLMLSYDGRAVILDFGLAQARLDDERSSITRAGQVMGTPKYMSPEQIATPDAVDARTDQYSAAVTLYVAAIGRTVGHDLPNGDDNLPVHELWARMMTPTWPRFTELAPRFPAAMNDVMARALSVRMDDRFPTVRAFRDAVRATMGEEQEPALGRFVSRSFAIERRQQEAWVDERVEATAVFAAQTRAAPRPPGSEAITAPSRRQDEQEATVLATRPASAPAWIGAAVASALALTIGAWALLRTPPAPPPSEPNAAPSARASPAPLQLPGPRVVPRPTATPEPRSDPSDAGAPAPEPPPTLPPTPVATPAGPSRAPSTGAPPSRAPRRPPRSRARPRPRPRASNPPAAPVVALPSPHASTWSKVDTIMADPDLSAADRERAAYRLLAPIAPHDIEDPCSKAALNRLEVRTYILRCRP
jgi:serine/threonine-protein kinase